MNSSYTFTISYTIETMKFHRFLLVCFFYFLVFSTFSWYLPTFSRCKANLTKFLLTITHWIISFYTFLFYSVCKINTILSFFYKKFTENFFYWIPSKIYWYVIIFFNNWCYISFWCWWWCININFSQNYRCKNLFTKYM